VDGVAAWFAGEVEDPAVGGDEVEALVTSEGEGRQDGGGVLGPGVEGGVGLGGGAGAETLELLLGVGADLADVGRELAPAEEASGGFHGPPPAGRSGVRADEADGGPLPRGRSA